MKVTEPAKFTTVTPGNSLSPEPTGLVANRNMIADSFIGNAPTITNESTAPGKLQLDQPVKTAPQPTVLKDNTIHDQFNAQGTHLGNLWDNVLDLFDNRGFNGTILEVADRNFEKNFSAKLPNKIAIDLDATLHTIQQAILDTPNVEPKLREAVTRYFTLASYEARLGRGDEYMLSAPATPVKIITSSDGSKEYQTFETVAQSSTAFGIINPEDDIAVEPIVEDPYLGVKKFFLYYLMASGKAISFYNGIVEGRALLKPQPEKLEGGWFGGPTEKEDRQIHGKETLREIDNREFMREELDNQGRHGYCWTFAASRLAEEQVCKTAPKSDECKSRVSPLDISYDNWRFATSSEGGFIGDGLQNTIAHGVCLNNKAFYPDAAQEKEIVNHINGYFKAVLSEPGKVDHESWKTVTLENGNQTVTLNDNLMGAVRTVETQSQSWFRFWQWPLRMGIWNNPLGSSLKATTSTLSSGESQISEALRDTLISNGCTDNRITGAFEDLNHSTKFFSPYGGGRAEKLENMKTALEHGNSLGIGMCVSRHMGQAGCGGHAIVMDGVRYDQEADKWEAHFINSWGEESKVMNGWKDLGDIVDDIIGITYYHPQETVA